MPQKFDKELQAEIPIPSADHVRQARKETLPDKVACDTSLSHVPHAGPEDKIMDESSYPERRSSPRIDLQHNVRLNLKGSDWEGIVLNISLGGVYLVFDATFSAFENQTIQLHMFNNEVAVLEFRGTVRRIHEGAGPQIGTPGKAALGLAVAFASLGDIKSQILASLLERLRERSVSVKFMALLVSEETGDLLLEVSSKGTDAVLQKAIHPCPAEGVEGLTLDRRMAPRVKLSIHARIEALNGASTVLYDARTENLSVNGACIRFQEQSDLLGRHLRLHLYPAYGVAIPPSMQAAHVPECAVIGEVMWTAQGTVMPAEPRQASSASVHLAGVRFLPSNDKAYRRIAELLGRFLISPGSLEDAVAEASLISELKECRNSSAQRIAIYHDRPSKHLSPLTPLVIISPGYGETKREYVALAYYFASNGFHVLRYDHTNHVGESEGDIHQSTLSHMKEDLLAVVNYAERSWPGSPMVVVATSLAGRVALKAITPDHRVKLLVLVTPVVDVQTTLLAVHQEDHLDKYLHGNRKGIMNVLGFNIDADRWLGDAIREGYSDLQSTIRDAEQCNVPVILFTAENDAWVPMELVMKVQAALGSRLRTSYLIPEALHRLQENPRKTQAVFRQLITCCVKEFYPLSHEPDIAEPPPREVALQNRLELKRARAQHQMAKTDALEFWRDYLAHFHYIVNSFDYWHLLDHIYRLTGTCDRGERILDVGCGNGNFGMFLMINQAYRRRSAQRIDSKPLSYIAVDFVPSALLKARLNLMNLAEELRAKFPAVVMTRDLIRPCFSLADLNLPLPFHDDQFDRIVCNLVIGYLQDPLFTLRELMRVLSPNGRLVLTNLKPRADLSQIYRNFLQIAKQPEEVEEARQVLNNSGKIKQGESNGIFRFFDRNELGVLLVACGGVQPRIYSTFGNQAYVAVTEKPGTMHAPPTKSSLLPQKRTLEA